MEIEEYKEYEVLGYKFRLSAEDNRSSVSPEDVVALVNSESIRILEEKPSLDKSQVAILVALKLASRNIELNADFREQIQNLESSAKDALEFIEQAKPEASLQ